MERERATDILIIKPESRLLLSRAIVYLQEHARGNAISEKQVGKQIINAGEAFHLHRTTLASQVRADLDTLIARIKELAKLLPENGPTARLLRPRIKAALFGTLLRDLDSSWLRTAYPTRSPRLSMTVERALSNALSETCRPADLLMGIVAAAQEVRASKSVAPTVGKGKRVRTLNDPDWLLRNKDPELIDMGGQDLMTALVRIYTNQTGDLRIPPPVSGDVSELDPVTPRAEWPVEGFVRDCLELYEAEWGTFPQLTTARDWIRDAYRMLELNGAKIVKPRRGRPAKTKGGI